ncbi:hypothetical protein [Winogradskyella sp. UBA3174]|uniref:hypothetical protein n=1 Tax=Winogradskyella sp. UBA3174 TaxID=1947785 RepID=UPI0025E26043|nr:hypothetical protein [Winogradskyella sp. UBA3174]|tara:strand:- start:14163 stop:14696 length:534 start_codon:yes stop_codon:yes gene_type:complete
METILEKGTENHLHILYEQQLKHNDKIKNKRIRDELVINDGVYADFWILKMLSNGRNYSLRNHDTFNNTENDIFYSLDYYSATVYYSVIWNKDFVLCFRNGEKLNTVKALNKNNPFVKQYLIPLKINISKNHSLPNITKSDHISTGKGLYLASIVQISNSKVVDVKTKFWVNGNLNW